MVAYPATSRTEAGQAAVLENYRQDPGPPENLARTLTRVSVVIPTLNEEQNISWVLENLPPIVDEIVLVDGRSIDRTIEVAEALRPDIVVVRETTPGKGAALRAAFAVATGDIVVMLDADCSMDPAEIPAFVHAVRAGADVAKGSRFLAGGGSVDISGLRRAGNGALLQLTNMLYGATFSELCYGYMAFRRTSLLQLGLTSTGFEIETEIVVRSLKAGLRITEVPSFEAERRYGSSNLRTFRDGWRVARTVLRERFRSSITVLIEPPTTALVSASIQEPQVRSEP